MASMAAILTQRDIIEAAKLRQTIGEKQIYLAFQVNRLCVVVPNTEYELETLARQELLAAIAPYFTQIMQYLTTPTELELLNVRFPRWIENIFTRNTRASKRIYTQSMMGVSAWADNGWNAECFNVFCSALSSEINALLLACGVMVKSLSDFKFVVQVVTQAGGWWRPVYDQLSPKGNKIYRMGALFKACRDETHCNAAPLNCFVWPVEHMAPS